jgi:uncharacterized membrane protein
MLSSIAGLLARSDTHCMNTLASSPTRNGLSSNASCGLAYLFGFITGIIFLLIEPRNLRIRFHSIQSILLNVVWIAVYIAYLVVFGILSHLPGLGLLFGVLSIPVAAILGVGFFILWLVVMVRAFGGGNPRIPGLAPTAERYAQREPAISAL